MKTSTKKLRTYIGLAIGGTIVNTVTSLTMTPIFAALIGFTVVFGLFYWLKATWAPLDELNAAKGETDGSN